MFARELVEHRKRSAFLNVRIGYCSELSTAAPHAGPDRPNPKAVVPPPWLDQHQPGATGNPPGLSSHFNPIFPLVLTVAFPPATKLV